jgi:hypothetical protein
MKVSRPPPEMSSQKRANVKPTETENLQHFVPHNGTIWSYTVISVSLFRHSHVSQQEFMVSSEFVKHDFHKT